MRACLLFCSMLAIACGEKTSSCVPGAVVACPCGDGSQGAQECRGDGTFGSCACPVPDLGTPRRSGIDVCKKGCDAVGACNGNTSGQIRDCKTQCENVDPVASCTNAEKIITCYDACYDKLCNQINDCSTGCEQCVQ
jgi:hypothetical protein